MANIRTIPDFEDPPLNEVVCGIQFGSLDKLLAAHIGLFWQRHFDAFTEVREVAPIQHIIEGQADSQFGLEVSSKPPLPRTWLLNKDRTEVIQIQNDRFLYNWKRAKSSDNYPRYEKVIQSFKEKLFSFRSFLQEKSLGEIAADQYELTYLNHIKMGCGWRSFQDIGDVFPDFAWRGKDRFLKPSERFVWQSVFELPNQRGNLHSSIKTAKMRKDGTQILHFELTARGIPNDNTEPAMWNWFDFAREWIVNAFTDLTGAKMHEIWKRKL